MKKINTPQDTAHLFALQTQSEIKKIDYTKYIEPVKQILVTKNNITIAILIKK